MPTISQLVVNRMESEIKISFLAFFFKKQKNRYTRDLLRTISLGRLKKDLPEVKKIFFLFFVVFFFFILVYYIF
jgi:hypothetical protein